MVQASLYIRDDTLHCLKHLQGDPALDPCPILNSWPQSLRDVCPLRSRAQKASRPGRTRSKSTRQIRAIRWPAPAAGPSPGSARFLFQHSVHSESPFLRTSEAPGSGAGCSDRFLVLRSALGDERISSDALVDDVVAAVQQSRGQFRAQYFVRFRMVAPALRRMHLKATAAGAKLCFAVDLCVKHHHLPLPQAERGHSAVADLQSI